MPKVLWKGFGEEPFFQERFAPKRKLFVSNMKISAFIVAYNEADNIANAVKSLNFADEIVVIDNASDDDTGEIALELGAKVIRVGENLGYTEAKKLAIENCANRWVFWLDADERVSPKLAGTIAEIPEKDFERFAAFRMRRKSFFIRRWIRHCGWGNEKIIRLFDKTRAEISNSLVHEGVIPRGPVGDIDGEILHYTARDLYTFFTKQMKYARLSAEQMIRTNRKIPGLNIIFRPVAAFIRTFFIKLGILDGVEGFAISAINACYTFLKYATAYYWTMSRKEDLR